MSSSPKRAPRRKIIGANWEAQQPRRGRPPADRPRKATRVYLTPRQRDCWLALTDTLAPLGAARIDAADLVVSYLEGQLTEMQTELTGSGQVLPVGVVDLKSLYFLFDLKPSTEETKQYNVTMYMETREMLSVVTIRLQSVFQTTWSQVFGLAIELCFHRLANKRGQFAAVEDMDSLDELRQQMFLPQQLRLAIQ